jgi:hypothetical protein
MNPSQSASPPAQEPLVSGRQSENSEVSGTIVLRAIAVMGKPGGAPLVLGPVYENGTKPEASVFPVVVVASRSTPSPCVEGSQEISTYNSMT